MVGQTTFTTSREGRVIKSVSKYFVVSKKFKLDAGCYVILPTTFHPNQMTSFYLRAYRTGVTPFEVVELGQRRPESAPNPVSYVIETPTNVRASKGGR